MRAVLFAALLGAVASTASAATYDAFASFDGVGSATDGAFTFGLYDGLTFTAFDTSGGSTFPATLAYTFSGAVYPAAVKTATGGSYISNTVTIPADALVLHPGPNPSNGGPFAAIRFVAPIAANYTIVASAVQIDSSINTVAAGFVFRGVGTGFDLSPGSPTSLLGYAAVSLNTIRTFAAGESLTLLIGNAGNYYSDTTAVNLTLSTAAVPEPAAWSLMIGGFGLIGAALRRRQVAIPLETN